MVRFFDDLHPVLLSMLRSYSKYYVIPESNHALLNGRRAYKISSDVVGCFSEAFYMHYNKVKIDYSSCDEKLHGCILDMQKQYIPFFVKAIKYDAEKLKKGFEVKVSEYMQLSYAERSQKIQLSLENISAFNKIDFLHAFADAKQHVEVEVADFDSCMRLFLKAHMFFVSFTDMMKDKSKSFSLKTDSADPYIIAFNHFLTHVSFAYEVYRLLDTLDEKQRELAENYINANLHRGLRHLERSILDIYKIILVHFVCNSDFFEIKQIDYEEILKIRQYEINKLSNSFEEKISMYHSFVSKNSVIQKSEHLSEILK